jgi:short-subunit dehydrogenase
MAFPRPDPAATAVVTGASSGIGTEFARLLAGEGYNVTLVARREERLRELAGELERQHGVRADVAAHDLTDPEQRAELARGLALRVDVLVNNAGFATGGAFHESDLQGELDQVRLLCETPVDLLRRFLPGMVERGAGAVVNVTSTAGMQPLPNSAGYAAAKAHLLSLSEAVHAEVRRHHVHVTALCPPPVRTELFDKEEHPVERVPRIAWLDPDEVARAGWEGAKANKRVVVPGAVARVTSPIARLAPRAIQLRLTERAFRS